MKERDSEREGERERESHTDRQRERGRDRQRERELKNRDERSFLTGICVQFKCAIYAVVDWLKRMIVMVMIQINWILQQQKNRIRSILIRSGNINFQTHIDIAAKIT